MGALTKDSDRHNRSDSLNMWHDMSQVKQNYTRRVTYQGYCCDNSFQRLHSFEFSAFYNVLVSSTIWMSASVCLLFINCALSGFRILEILDSLEMRGKWGDRIIKKEEMIEQYIWLLR